MNKNIQIIIAVVAVALIGGSVYVNSSNPIGIKECPEGQVYQGTTCVVPVPGNVNLSMSGGKYRMDCPSEFMDSWNVYKVPEKDYSICYPRNYHVAFGTSLVNYDEYDYKYEKGNPEGVKIQVQKTATLTPTSTATVTFSERVTNSEGGTFDLYKVTGSDGKESHWILIWGAENDRTIVSQILSSFKFTSPKTDNNLIAPSIQIHSPKSGERIAAGSTYQIKWSSNKISDRVMIVLNLVGSMQQIIYSKNGTSNTIENTGSFSWKVPESFGDDLLNRPLAREYKAYITIQDANNKSIIAQSQEFSIVPAAQTVINDGTMTPIITSITQPHGPLGENVAQVGSTIEIKGKYLNGFEGSTVVAFVDSKGQKGYLEVNSYAPEGATTLKFTLPVRLCTQVLGQSGNPCPSYLEMTPGVYKITVKPWAKESNELTLIITQ